MSRFGIRKKLKSALKKTVFGEAEEPPTSPAPPPATSTVKTTSSERAKPPPAAPTPSPKMPPAAVPPAPVAPAAAKSAEMDRSLGTTWVQAAGVKPDEVVPATVHAVQILGKRYALYKTDDGDFFATPESCPHAGGPLAEGELDGFEITCPFHSWSFDVRDGSCTSGGGIDVDCTSVRVVDEMVMLEVPL